MARDDGSFFDSAYDGTPPWDIGRPQPEFARLAEIGEIQGSVIDVGCGTGENALFMAGRGHEVWGIDFASRAIHKAKSKAKRRGLKVNFRRHDALHLDSLHRTFDSAIDSGLFHTFSDEDRPRFARSLAAVLHPAGTYHMMCFSEKEPEDWGGPRRVTQAEIKETFGRGWRVNYIREARFETNMPDIQGRAWLSSISRL